MKPGDELFNGEARVPSENWRRHDNRQAALIPRLSAACTRSHLAASPWPALASTFGGPARSFGDTIRYAFGNPM